MLKLLNGLDKKTLTKIKTAFEANNSEIINISDNLRRGIVEIFGLRGEVEKLIAGIDPWTNQKWPDDHYKNIYFNPGYAPGDVKFLWEFMKHNFLPALGKAYLLTGNEVYLKSAIEFINTWLGSVADDKGVSWAGHPHICQRMINWLLFRELAQQSPLFTPKLQTELEAYLDKQWALLEKEYHSPINNHKLLSLCFVILNRLYHNQEDELDFWLEELKGSNDLLIYPDGGFAEQSISYHRLCVESLLFVIQGLKNAGVNVPDWLSQTIVNSLVYFEAITQPNGKLPVFGDNSDEILLVREWPEEFWDLEYLFAWGSALGLKVRKAVAVPASIYWLVGLKGISQSKTLPLRPDMAEFEHTGHFILRNNQNSYVFFRAGEFGLYVPNASNHPHSHCDQLGMVAFLDNTEVLTDPGTYRYNENDYERRLLKDESFHTTVKVNGKSQAKYLSSFAYGEALNAEGKLEGSYLKGRMGRDGWQIQRTVELQGKKLLITDSFLGDAEVEWFFALSAFLVPIKVEPGKAVLKEVGTLRIINFNISEPITPEVLPGYISHRYNRANPSQRLYFKLKINREKQLQFLFEVGGRELSKGKYR